MPCYHPIPAEIEYNGRAPPYRRSLKLNSKTPTIWVPCQKCLGCREIQQQELAIRATHEARYYEDKHFLTLTYDDKNLPDGLRKPDMQKFWKRLRQTLSRANQQWRATIPIRAHSPIKHLTCGEYGDRTKRPHYHAAVLGLAINDLKRWDITNSTSDTISEIWGNGIVTISELTEDRIKYVAGYVLKKAGYQKQIYCTPDGEILQEPYRDMSKGMGKRWINDFQQDLRNGYINHKGAKHSIPRYYRDIISTNETLANQIEESKASKWKELTPEDRKALHTGEKIRQQQIKQRRNRPL
jgi:hypothetical protein